MGLFSTTVIYCNLPENLSNSVKKR